MATKKSANKTVKTDQSVADFLEKIDDETQKRDCFTILNLMGRLSGSHPKMWGSSIIGFGDYHYRYESGREGDFFRIGFAPRKGKLSLYIMSGFSNYDELLAKLGKHKTGKSCLYIKRLDDVDMNILEEICRRSLDYMAKTYPE